MSGTTNVNLNVPIPTLQLYDPISNQVTQPWFRFFVGLYQRSGGSTATAGGDLTGNYPNPTVFRIRGAPLGTTTPTAGNLLVASGTEWRTIAMSGDATMASSGVLSLSATAVTAGSYGDASHVATFTVDAAGRLTAAASVAIGSVPPSGPAGGDLSGTYPNPTVAQVHGVTTNSSASAGLVGEYISSTVLVGSAVSLTSATPANVTSISLTAGDWDVWGTVAFAPGGTTTITIETGGINTTSATLPTSPGSGAISSFNVSLTGLGDTFSVGSVRVSLASTTTVYLVAQSTFAVSTQAAYGFLGARRRR